MDSDKFYKLMTEDDIELTDEERIRIIKLSVATCSKEIKSIVIMEELSELQKEVSKAARGTGDYYNMIEEMADVLICLGFLRELYNISDDDITKALNIKLIRERDRREPTW